MALLAVVLSTAPSTVAARPSAARGKALLSQAKALRANGDDEGALAKYLEAQEHVPRVKVSKWIVRRYLKTGRKLEAAEYLKRIIRERRPSKHLTWAAKTLGPLMGEVQAAREAAVKAQIKAAAHEAEVAKDKAVKEATERTKSETERRASAAAEAKATATAARHDAELAQTKKESAAAQKQSDEAWRAKLMAQEEARSLPMYLIIGGAAVTGLSLFGSTSFSLDAAHKRGASHECWSDLLERGVCSDSEYNDLQTEAQDNELASAGFATVAALGVVTAAVGGVLLWQAVRAEYTLTDPTDGADGGESWLSDGWNQAWLAFGASAAFIGVSSYHGWWGGRVVERREALRGTARVPATLFTDLDEQADSAALTANLFLALSVVTAGAGVAALHYSGEAPWSAPGAPEAPEAPKEPEAPEAPEAPKVQIGVGPTGVGLSFAF